MAKVKQIVTPSEGQTGNPDDGSGGVPTGTGSKDNCLWNGKEYSPGGQVKDLSGNTLYCVSGAWLTKAQKDAIEKGPKEVT